MSNSPRVPGSGNSDDNDDKDQGSKPASPFASKPATPNPFASKSSEPARTGGGGGSSSGTGSPFGSKPAGSPSPFGSGSSSGGNKPNDPPKPGGSSIFGGGNKPNDPPKTGPLGGGSGSGSGIGSPFGGNKPAGGGGSPFAPSGGGGNRPDDDKNKTGSASSASPKLGAPSATPAKTDDKSGGGGAGGRLGGLFGGGGNKPDDKKDDKPAGGAGAGASGGGRPGGLFGGGGGSKPADKKDDKPAGAGGGAPRLGGVFGGGGNKPDDKKDDKSAGGAARPGGLFGGGGNKPADKKDDKADGGGAGGRLGGLFGGGGNKPADNKPAAPKLGGTPAPAAGAKPADKKDAGGGGSPFARMGGMFKRGGDKGGDKPATPKLGGPATPAKPADKNAAGGRANPLNSVGARLGSIFNRGGGDPQKALKAPQIPPDAKKGTATTGKAALPPARGDKPARPLERAGTSLEVKNRGLSLDQKLDLVGYALMIAALVMFGGLVQPSEGSVTRDVANLLGQLFGYGRFIWPAISMFVGGWLLIRRFKENPLLELDLMRIIGFTLLYLTAVTVLHFYELVQKVVPDRATLFAISEQLARQQIGGGWVGDKIYQALIYVVGEWGVPFVLIGLLAIGNMLTFEITLGEIAQYVQSIFRWFGRVGRSYGDRRAIAKEASDKRRAERAAEKAARDAARLAARPAAPALTVETPALAQVAAPAAAALAAPAEAKPEIPRLGRGNNKATTGTTAAATTATPAAEQVAPAIPKLTTPKPLGKAEPPAAAASAPALRPVAAAAAAAAIAAPDIDDEDEDYEDDDAPEVSAAPAIPKLSTPPAPLGRAPSNPPPTTPAPTAVPAPAASTSKLAEPMTAKEDTRPLESTRPITTPAPTSASPTASKPNIFGKPLGTPDENKGAPPVTTPAATATPAASAVAEKVEAKPSGSFNPFKAAQPQPQNQEKPAAPGISATPLGGNGSAIKPVDQKAAPAKMPVPDEYADDDEDEDVAAEELKPATPKGIATPPSPFGSSGSGSSARPSPFGAAKSTTGTSSAFAAKPTGTAKAADADIDDEDEDEVIPAAELKPATPKGIAPAPDKTATGTTLSARPAPKPGGTAVNTPADDADDEDEDDDDVKYEKLDDAADLDDDEAADEEASKPMVLPKPPVGTLTPLAKPNGSPAPTAATPTSTTSGSAAAAPEQKPAAQAAPPAPSAPASPFGSRPAGSSGAPNNAPATTSGTPARPAPPPAAGNPFGQRPATAAPAASGSGSGTSASSPFGNKPLTATPTPPPTAAPISPAASAATAKPPVPVQPEIEDEVDEDETSAEEMSTPVATTASSAPVRIQHHESDVTAVAAKSDIPAFSRGTSGWPMPDLVTTLETSSSARVNERVIEDRKNMIEETLEAFGTPGKVVEINAGPVITQFGVEPGYLSQRGGKQTRVKVSAIAKLDADLALALAAKSIRIEAPVPGKGYVGIEVPNAETAVVGLRDLMLAPEFQKIKSKLRIALGKSVDGAPIVADLTTMPHLLVAGTTGSGKSVCVNAIISCLLLQNSPDDLKLVMVDPKRVELTGYNGIPHLVANVVVDLERIVGVLKWVTREMEERYKKFSAAGARNILDYNGRIGPMDPKLPYLVVLIDELADLMMLAPEETEKVLTRLAQMARATGIHLILSTQRPSVDVVTGLIKANFPSRISFAVASSVDSRVILDQPGAEKLLGRGDMLYQAPDAPAPTRVQGVYVSDAEINKITQHWKVAKFEAGDGKSTPALTATTFSTAEKPAEPVQSRHSMFGGPRSEAPASGAAPRTSWEPSRDPNRAVYTSVNAREAANGDDDDMYEEAVDLFKKMGKVSVSLLQRRLRVGYTRAERLIKMMKERKVITDADTTAGDGDEE